MSGALVVLPLRDGAMRTFEDTTGLEWTVFEVKKVQGSTERWSYLPDEFGNGWLCFESHYGKRRLTPIPARWREYGDGELRSLLDQAAAVARPRSAMEDRANAD